MDDVRSRSSRRSITPAGFGSWAGVVLLVGWCAWWGLSLSRNRLALGEWAWFEALPFLSGDFTVSIDHVARVRAAGLDPYAADWVCRRYPYPPLVTASFRWVTLFRPGTALAIWTVALAVIFSGSAWAAWRARRRLGLVEIPGTVAIAAVLFSSPVVLAMERGQCDALVLPLIGLGAWLLGRGRHGSDWAAGGVFGLAAWHKYYPGIVLLGLLGFRRTRAVAGFVLVGLAVGLADPVGVVDALSNAHHAVPALPLRYPAQIHHAGHSLTTFWRPLWAGTPLAFLKAVPGAVGACALVVPFVVQVTRRVGRTGDAARLAFPLCLWLVAAGTFLTPAAIDYNLVFLPLAALAVWDVRDRPMANLLMALSLVALQPLMGPVSGRVLFLFKLAGLAATGLCLARRADEIRADPTGKAAAAPSRPSRVLRTAAAAR